MSKPAPWWEVQLEEFRRMTPEEYRQYMRKQPWWCDQCKRTHLLGRHDPKQPPDARCVFAAGSLYCVRDDCTNPRHRARF